MCVERWVEEILFVFLYCYVTDIIIDSIIGLVIIQMKLDRGIAGLHETQLYPDALYD